MEVLDQALADSQQLRRLLQVFQKFTDSQQEMAMKRVPPEYLQHFGAKERAVVVPAKFLQRFGADERMVVADSTGKASSSTDLGLESEDKQLQSHSMREVLFPHTPPGMVEPMPEGMKFLASSPFKGCAEGMSP
jgi:hypothetical protein